MTAAEPDRRGGRSFYEFFCGGGMARVGLGAGWTCTLANDMDPVKCAAYRANFGGDHLIEGDIHDLAPGDLPGRAALAWASFPCQDLSLAGARKGFEGGRSAAFWGFHGLMAALAAEGRAPRTLVIENVVGFASSRGGADLDAALGALAEIGYRYDLRILDAASFLPQSRPRLFVIAWRGDGLNPGPASGAAAGGAAPDRGAVLAKAVDRLGPAAAAGLSAIDLAPPPRGNTGLSAVVETGAPVDPPVRTAALMAMAAPAQAAKLAAALEAAAASGAPVHGAAFRRMRGGVQRVEMRFDVAGCLRTPAGGSSKQILVIANPDGTVASRWFTGREAARLMGLPDEYRLPARETDALRLAGDGVAAPVARWIAEEALAPLLNPPLEPAAAAE